MSEAAAGRGRFSDALLADIRARTSIVEIVAAADIRLRRRSREHVGLCPFHRERTPSFTVSEEKGAYFCFGCGASGDAIRFLQEAGGLTFVEAVEELAVRAGLAADREGRTRPQAPPVPRPGPDEEAGREAAEIAKAVRLWRGSQEARGTVVEAYLREGRGLRLEAIGGLPRSLRLLPARDYWHEGRVVHRGPAMVAPLVTGDRRVVGAHITWLAADGSGKAQLPEDEDGKPLPAKKMRGTAWGACVPLGGRAAAMQGGEGIETALSGACAAPNLPAVALGSLGNFAGAGLWQAPGRRRKHPHKEGVWLPNPAPDPERPGWLPPEGCREFTWLADLDAGDAPSAERLLQRGCRRLAAAGIAVRVARPDEGDDFNDLYRRGEAA